MKTMGEILHANCSCSDDFDMQLIGKFLSFASRGDTVGLNQMLIKGISPDVQDYDGRTALHLAESEGHLPLLSSSCATRPMLISKIDGNGQCSKESTSCPTQTLDSMELPADFKPKFHLSRCSNRIQQLIEECTSNDPSQIPPFSTVIAILEEESLSLGRAACPVC